jgi:hypothetical protein
MMHPKASVRVGRSAVVFVVRLVSAVGLALCCAVFADGASWASTETTSAPSGSLRVSVSSSAASSSVIGSRLQRVSRSTASLPGVSTGSYAGSDAQAEPTAGETRQLIQDLAPAVLLGLGLLVAMQATTLILLFRRGAS